MATKCQICAHPQRKLIDAELARGGYNLSAISRHYEVSYHSLWRHKNNHLNAMLVKGYEVKVKEEGRDILNELDGLIGKLNGVLDRAEAKEQDGKLLRAARELKGFYELLSRLQFAIYQQKQMEVEESNDYLTIEFQENWDTLVESEEKEVWEAVMVKAIGGHTNRLPRIKYRDGNDAPMYDFSGIIGRQDSGSVDDDQEESISEEITGHTVNNEAQKQNEDKGQNDLRVSPIPIITLYDPLQKSKNRLK